MKTLRDIRWIAALVAVYCMGLIVAYGIAWVMMTLAGR